MMGYGGMVGFGGLWMVVPILFWAGLILLAVWGVGNLFPGRSPGRQDTALEILKQRYARGEISVGEYQQARKDLTE